MWHRTGFEGLLRRVEHSNGGSGYGGPAEARAGYQHQEGLAGGSKVLAAVAWFRAVVGKPISQPSQISTVQRLKFLLRAKFLKLKLLLTLLLQNRFSRPWYFVEEPHSRGQRAACGS